MEKIISIRKFVGRILFRSILYYGPEKYLFGTEGPIREVGGDRLKRVDIVVLNKRHYFETSKTFPFSSLKDIRSAVTMDISSMAPFKTDRFFVRKIAEEDGKATLNIWFIDPELCNVFDLSPRLIIPESALLSFLNEGVGKIYSIDRGRENLLVHAGTDLLVKSITGRDGDEGLLSFRRTIGAEARDCTVTVVKGMEEYLSLLCGILETIPLKRMLPFVNRDRFSLSGSQRNLKWNLGTGAVLICLFICLSFLLPYLAASRLESEDKALSHNLRQVLKSREDLEYFRKKQEGPTKRINNYPYKIELISLLNKLLPEKTRIRLFTVSGNMVEIQGTTSKGSELLSALGKEKGIKNAKFTAPIKQDKKSGMEIFSLSFAYEGNRNPEKPFS